MELDLSNKNPKIVKHWRKNPKAIDKYQFVHHFLPHADRKERSNFLSNKSLIVYCLALIIVLVTFRILPKFAPGVLSYASDIYTNDLLKYTNQKRREAGISDLVINDSLSRAAAKKASHMFEKNYWAHISPDGVEPWDFILGSGYDYIYAGENLAKNFQTSEDVVDAWYKSPSHKDNLLSSNYDEIGFAVVNGVLDGYETTLVVQMFGRPQDRSHLVVSPKEESTKGVETTQVPVEESIVVEVPQVEIPIASERSEVLPKIDIGTASKTLSLVMAGFVALLLALDIWYSKKKGITKFTGHSFAHLLLFTMAIISIWFVLRPGIIL